MKDLRCILGWHSWTEWEMKGEVAPYLERECKRCPAVDVKFPSPDAMFIHAVANLAYKYIEWKTPPHVVKAARRGIVFKREDHR